MPRQSNPRPRRACDRCHEAKLRCHRKDGPSCERCERLEQVCFFGFRQKRTVANRGSQITNTTNTQEEPTLLHATNPLDWSLFDFSHLLPPDNTPSGGGGDQWAGTCTGTIHVHEPQDDVADILPDSSLSTANTANSSSIRQLADLNVQLYEHAKTLPPLDISFADLPLLTSPSEGRLFAIDDTFKMTQSLINLVQQLYSPSPSSSSSSPSFSSDSMRDSSKDTGPDQGTALLILSCANRVFDIYDNILHHMRSCITNCTAPVYADGKLIVLPPLRIGNFSPPKTTTVTMHMLMVVVMASGLFDQLQEALGFSSSSFSKSACMGVEIEMKERRFPDFAEEAREEVLERARAVAGDIKSTRVLLLESPAIRG